MTGRRQRKRGHPTRGATHDSPRLGGGAVARDATRIARSLAVVRAASLLVTFAGSVVLARSLGPADRGAHAFLVAGAVAAAFVLSLGAHTGSYVAITSHGQDARRFVSNAGVFAILGGALVAAGLVLPYVSSAVPQQLRTMALWPLPAALTVGGLVWNFHQLMLCLAGRRAAAGTMLTFAPYVLAATAYLAVMPLESSLDVAIWIFALSPLMVGIVASLPRLHLGLTPNSLPSPRLMLLSMGHGLRSYTGDVGGALHQRIDTLLLANIASAASLGIYIVAYQTAEPLLAIAATAATTTLAYEHGAGKEYDRGLVTASMIRQTMMFTVAIGTIAAIAAPFAIPIVYGDEFRGSVSVFLILVPAVVAFGVGRVASSYLLSQDRLRTNASVMVTAVLVNVAGNLLLIPHLGEKGAALASLISYLLFGILATVAYLRASGLSWVRIVPGAGLRDRSAT